MSHTLKTVNMITDERIIYKADEVIRMYGYKGMKYEHIQRFYQNEKFSTKFASLPCTVAIIASVAVNYIY
ncbi:hypothetical protein RO3G_07346 [Rhizopus delemar RA 99-880]|uniref:Uncharacterized protein n=1 Tax=Rhizopus delemar (strain RA 99-880 / ATCC MYA-4621 / FGSC 9543 / NRRL 43880) TaxID=246409 RepID=I1C2G1_RHIO9|nr:hypothetical protein RO3G_07346 [Rhizopus delemar RA 99-880]|eukprot:EIE82641.1 hypothetical protein RO3G_07346 [Rhizopus delemar RA 99-880]